MLKKLLAFTSVLVFVTAARAGITGSVLPLGPHTLDGSGGPAGTTVYSYDMQVTITGSDAWTVGGGPAVGVPWINLAGGTFFQSSIGDANPPDPAFIAVFADIEWTSFYTTHLGYPNVGIQGVAPGFASGPADTATSLNADWFWTPDASDYPGTFTIARFSIIEDTAGVPATGTIDMQIGSQGVSPFAYTETVVTPEPGSLALLALGGLALIRRR